MVGEISYVKPNDILQASEWNKVADYCNGPGEWSDQSQFISTRKGTIYQSSTQINPRMQPPRDLLRTEFRTWQVDENHLCSTAFMQLGPSYDRTRLEFKIEDKPIEFIVVCPLSSDPDHSRAYVVDDATTSCWNAVSGQGIINTFIPYGYNIVGQLVEANFVSSSYDPDLSGDISSYSGTYGLVINDMFTNGDPDELSTLMSELSTVINEQVSSLTATYGELEGLKLKYEFEIFAQTRYTFENEDQMSAWVSAVNIQPYVQCHIGGLDMFPKTSNPEPFDIEKGSIVRQYMMVGNKIMAVGNDISEGGSTELTSFFEEDLGVIACKVSDQVLSGQYAQSLELTGYHSLEELVADQSSPYYSIIPLYQFDLSAGQKLVCDFRHGPRSQNFESLGW